MFFCKLYFAKSVPLDYEGLRSTQELLSLLYLKPRRRSYICWHKVPPLLKVCWARPRWGRGRSARTWTPTPWWSIRSASLSSAVSTSPSTEPELPRQWGSPWIHASPLQSSHKFRLDGTYKVKRLKNKLWNMYFYYNQDCKSEQWEVGCARNDLELEGLIVHLTAKGPHSLRKTMYCTEKYQHLPHV